MSASFLHQLETLPPLPYVAHEILLALNDKDANMGSIAETLAREPGLTARIVSMANSAFFANQRPVYSPEDAVVRLGLNRVRVLAASILLAKQFDASRCPPFRAEQYWYEAVATAFSAARLSHHVQLDYAGDVAYLAGLLHNIGLLLLVYVFPGEMSKALRQYADDPEQSLSALTRQELGSDHHEAGRLLLSEWNLPEEISAVAAHIHQPAHRGPHDSLIAFLCFCREWVARGFDADVDIPPQLALNAERLASVAAQCRREQEQLEAFANLLAAG
jgi:HD-like signal output (HDOD) protein